jgi:dihydroneopterin aldolase
MVSRHTRGIPGRVALRGLRCCATQGDPPAATLLVVDVSIEIDLSAVVESDAYADVVDLADLAASVRQTVAAQPRRLLETIAVHAARGVLARYAAVHKVRLRVIKPEPSGLDAAEESVEVRLSRGTGSGSGSVQVLPPS